MLCSRQSGAPFWLGLHLMPVRGSSPPCFVLLGRDITEALHASQQQTAIQGLLGKVFLCVKAPVAIVSDTGLIHMTNPAMDDLLGYAPGALVGKRAVDAMRPVFVRRRSRQFSVRGKTDGVTRWPPGFCAPTAASYRSS